MSTTATHENLAEQFALDGDWTREDLLPFCASEDSHGGILAEPWTEWNYRGDGTETGDRALRDAMPADAYAQFHYDTLASNGKLLVRLPRRRVRWCRDGDTCKPPPPALNPLLREALYQAQTLPATVAPPPVPAPDWVYMGAFAPSDWPDGPETDPDYPPSPEDCNLVPWERPQYSRFLGRVVASNVMRKLVRCLPGLRFVDDAATARTIENGVTSAIDIYKFRFTGGHGILMPCRDSALDGRGQA